MARRRILTTSALPYANGPIHIGHLVEYIQTDIWVRFQKLRGHRCCYLCADDTHGTAIMLRARKEGIAEEELIARMSAEHQRDFAAFDVEFDHYGSTNSPASRELCGRFWKALRDADLVVEKAVERLYDPEAGVFLADRFVRGTCPRCGAEEQYGDNCERCNAAYAPTDLVEPRSILSGAVPEVRESDQLFVRIEALRGFLERWVREDDHLQKEVANYLEGHFLGQELHDWDVSRPAPYFGFEIPDAPGNYWYVWFDAPIGYIGATAEWCLAHGERLEDWWRNDATEIHHFIGKDIIYFHTLFWPAMLRVAEYNLPTRVQIHGFLTVDGAKMSKSKGTLVEARRWAEHLDPAYLRYFYASKLGPGLDDLDLGLEEFAQKVDSDLVGKVVNLASRTAKFVQNDRLAPTWPDDGGLFAAARDEADAIAEAYERCDYNQAMRRIMALADRANEFVEREAPWRLRKQGRTEELRAVCTVALNLFRQIVLYLAPALPRLQAATEELLSCAMDRWDLVAEPVLGSPVAPYRHLCKRVDRKALAAMIDVGKEAAGPPPQTESQPATCTIDDFSKLDLRVAEVVAADRVDGADKLLRLTCELGEDDRRTVFAGIKEAYEPADLVGRKVVMIANLAPRKMRFGVSEGMILAAGNGGQNLHLIAPDDGARPGEVVG